jgi:hypothetical protein
LMSKKVNLLAQPDQAAIYAQASGFNDPTESGAFWHIDPKGYETTMDTRDSGPRAYVIFAFTNQAEANAKIAYTIDHYEVAPGVLIAGGPQWVLATGYETDGAGALVWLKIHDPSFNGSGTGFNMVTAGEWNGTWFKPVSAGTKWLGKYVMVCDPEPNIEPLYPMDRPHVLTGERLIAPGEAIELAMRGIKDYDLQRFGQFQVAMTDGHPGRPYLVRDADYENRQYYLVPFYRTGEKRGMALGAATIDARYGDLLSTMADPAGFALSTVGPREIPRLLEGYRIPRYEPVEALRSRLADRVSSLLDAGSKLDGARFLRLQEDLTTEVLAAREPRSYHTVHSREIEIAQTLVWKSTPFSATPLAPFWEVFVGSFKAYVRLWDGLILIDLFPWLRPLGG